MIIAQGNSIIQVTVLDFFVKMSVNPRIIIIGAGAAGYAAACKLLENGFTNIQVLEAENRIGGRVRTVEFGDGLVEMGAQWCHGEKDNIVYGMVKDLNLLQPSSFNYGHFRFVNAQGNFLDTNVTDKLIDLLHMISDDKDELQKQNGSLGEYITKRYNEIVSTKHSDVDKKITNCILDWVRKLENILNGSKNWNEVSAKGISTFQNCEGDMTLNWKDKGYRTVFSVLKKALPDPANTLPVDDKILFNKEVERISWDDTKKDTVTVECSDGTKYTADHVICTVSLGVLKATHKRMFTPELPANKVNAIQGLAIDTIDKIFLKFPTKWWPDKCLGFSFIWSGEDSSTVLNDFPEGRLANGKSWLESVCGFYPIDNNPNVLLGWVDGELVPDIEALSDDVVRRGSMHLLKTFVGKHYNICDPDTFLRTAWHTSKHFQGSYSYRSLESDRLNVSAADLAQPLGNNAVLFAGEATHSSFYSTVHGAIETGHREAQRIISQYGSGNNPKL